MAWSLTARQLAALADRFGDVLDVEMEVRHASEYLESEVARRKPKNFGRFCWNWCLNSESRRFRNMPRKERQAIEALRSGKSQSCVRASENPPLSREQLESIANDPAEPPDIRELARAELAEMEN